jgi:hypothetical protein
MMDFLNNKEWYVTQTEKTIENLKLTEGQWEAKQSLKALAKCVDKQAVEYQEVYDWLLHCLRDKPSLEHPIEHLSTQQCSYAYYLMQAITDSVTMTI